MKWKIIWSPLALTRVNEETEYIARDKPGPRNGLMASSKRSNACRSSLRVAESFPISAGQMCGS